MASFASVYSYQHFAAAVMRRSRYVRNAEQTAFLDALLELSMTKRETLPAGSPLYRARLGCRWAETPEEEERDPGPRPYKREEMKPPRDGATDGRANPRGIPCLYTATHPKTAAAEVRPWLGSQVTVAKLKTTRALTVVNCTSDDQRHMIYLKEPDDLKERETNVWRDIDRAFAHPSDRNEISADYAPTQIIAEMFRQNGLDGIAYRSSLGDGHNVALFDVDAADVVSRVVYEVKRIQHDIEPMTNAY
jgi:hypothetical protein